MEHPQNKPYIVIMAGGGGTRLWPKSRQSVPKQFLQLFSKKTLLQETYSRIAPITDNNRIFIAAPEKYKEEILRELPDLNEQNLVLEPEARDSAPAIGLASVIIHHRDPEAVVHFIASDDYIVEVDEFQRVLLSATIMAEQSDNIVLWGVRPTFPSTGYGYIQSGDEIAEINRIPILKLRAFREKPNITTAQAYLATGKYFWNTSKFSQKARVMLDAIKHSAPELWRGLEKIQMSLDTDTYALVMHEVFAHLDKLRIEEGVMEKVSNIIMIPADYTWSDVGSWDALYDISDKNDGTNSVLTEEGEFFGYDTHGCLIQTNGKNIATIGLSDMIVIDTENVIMICPKSRCQDVKKMVEMLKEKDKKDLL
jgi:mannose-1-phosphate guanylyltransferase